MDLIEKIELYKFENEAGVLNNCKDWIELKKQFYMARDDQEWLGYLDAAGVDNWVGFEHAQEMRDTEQKEETD